MSDPTEELYGLVLFTRNANKIPPKQFLKWIKKGANVNAQLYEGGQTPLMLSLSVFQYNKQFLDILRVLLENGTDPNLKDNSGFLTTRKIFLINDDSLKVEVMKLLLEFNCDINALDRNNETVLAYAVGIENRELVKYLLDNGADPYKGESALFAALWLKNTEMLTYLLDYGIDPNRPCTNTETPLIRAINRGNLDGIKVLIEKGADVNGKNNNGETALQIAEKALTGIVPEQKWFIENIIQVLKENGA